MNVFKELSVLQQKQGWSDFTMYMMVLDWIYQLSEGTQKEFMRYIKSRVDETEDEVP